MQYRLRSLAALSSFCRAAKRAAWRQRASERRLESRKCNPQPRQLVIQQLTSGDNAQTVDSKVRAPLPLPLERPRVWAAAPRQIDLDGRRREPTGPRPAAAFLPCDAGLTRRTSQCDGGHCQYGPPPPTSYCEATASWRLQPQPCGNEGSTDACIRSRVASVKFLASAEYTCSNSPSPVSIHVRWDGVPGKVLFGYLCRASGARRHWSNLDVFVTRARFK